jgi:hypothetical protein
VVLWFRHGCHLSAEEVQRHRIKRHRGGYVVFRSPHDTGSGAVPPYRDRLRKALAECAGATGVELVVSDYELSGRSCDYFMTESLLWAWGGAI